jgi:hypothetical protein
MEDRFLIDREVIEVLDGLPKTLRRRLMEALREDPVVSQWVF